jgi:N-acetylglucosamine kinase-like BadF-type ATPase
VARYVIGVDGGGTKTCGILTTIDGKEIARVETGSTNHYSNPIETVRQNLSVLIHQLREAAPAQPNEIIAIGLGMAGVDRPDDHRLMTNLVREILPKTYVHLDNDAVIALQGGSRSGIGIIVISGTGSIALGMNIIGERARAGGWGNILGDEGSGYSIGLKGLRAVCRAHDGRVGATVLTALVTRQLEIADATGVLGWIKGNQGAKDQIAALSRLVFQAAISGDESAQCILAEEAEELALAAAAVAGKLFPNGADGHPLHAPDGYEVVVAGGNLRNSQEFFSLFQTAVARRLPGVSVVQPLREPVHGAILLALQDTTKA